MAVHVYSLFHTSAERVGETWYRPVARPHGALRVQGRPVLLLFRSAVFLGPRGFLGFLAYVPMCSRCTGRRGEGIRRGVCIYYAFCRDFVSYYPHPRMRVCICCIFLRAHSWMYVTRSPFHIERLSV